MRKKVKKRTTIVFDSRDREFLDRLISEGKESGIKSFYQSFLTFIVQ